MTKPNASDSARAFLMAPDPKRYYAAAASEEARQRIVRSIARTEGPALLVGPAGMGKSTLLAVLAEQFRPLMSVALLPGSQLCTRRALLQMMLYQLGLPYRGMDEGELRLSILRYLKDCVTPARRLLVLVDEADALPTRLLEELRVLTNAAIDGVPLVSLVLAGGPILEERFADPELDMFSQRIAARCYLSAFSRAETIEYVRAQVHTAGGQPDALFDSGALDGIHGATGGVPRLVNQLADQLLWMADQTGCQPLDALMVQQAWSDLHQLPAPWNTDDASGRTPSASDAELVEFGELDDAAERQSASWSDTVEFGEADDAEDPPASIPIHGSRGDRTLSDIAEFADSIDETEDLLERLDDIDDFDAGADAPAEPAPPPLAADPFDEPFVEEEVVVDRYAAVETELFRSAPRVRNVMDVDFARQLDACVQTGAKGAAVLCGRAAQPDPPEHVEESDSPTPTSVKFEPPARREWAGEARPASGEAPVPRFGLATFNPADKFGSGEILVIEDDIPPAVNGPVPARQFRRLFTRLEAGNY